MLYKSLLVMIARDGLTEALRNKIDLLYVFGRLTAEQYRDLVDYTPEE